MLKRSRPHLRLVLFWMLAVAVPGNARPTAATMAVATVTVAATVSSAAEIGPRPGVFVFSRSGDTTSPLSVAFTLGGTALAGRDYVVWQTSARFESGASRAYVAFLPRNDAIQEGDERVVLRLQPSTSYIVGTPSSAVVTIKDTFVPNRPGIWDELSVDPQTGLPLVTPDLRYLDGWLAPEDLHVHVGLATLGGVSNIELFLDTDQNPRTGDFRSGHVGAEYRVHISAGLFNTYSLYRLPTVLPGDPNVAAQEELVGTGSIAQNNNTVAMSVPLVWLKSPGAIDLFATTHLGSAPNQAAGVGDRLPNYGVFATRSRQVAVRRPGMTFITRVVDRRGNNGGGFDLLSAELSTLADQFSITLEFAEAFDPRQPLLWPGPRGEVILDSDRSLLTGGLFMGSRIPTWGGDARLFFDVASLRAPGTTFILQFDPRGTPLVFGQDRNDGRWLASGNKLYLAGSLSMFDAWQIIVDGSNRPPQRVQTDGRMFAQTRTLDPSLGRIADALPAGMQSINTRTGQAHKPFVWNPAQTISQADPQEYGTPVSGDDLIRVDAQVIGSNLVVQAVLSAWLTTDVDNRFEVLLDTDMNSQTGERVSNAVNSGPEIGADYKVRVYSVDTGLATAYYADIVRPDGTITAHDALLRAQPTSSLTQQGSFTLTLPFTALGNPSLNLRLYVTAGREGDLARSDIAPASPLVVRR